MLFIAGGLVMLIALVIIRRMRAPGVNARTLGCMSEQWLAEHRAAQSP